LSNAINSFETEETHLFLREVLKADSYRGIIDSEAGKIIFHLEIEKTIKYVLDNNLDNIRKSLSTENNDSTEDAIEIIQTFVLYAALYLLRNTASKFNEALEELVSESTAFASFWLAKHLNIASGNSNLSEVGGNISASQLVNKLLKAANEKTKRRIKQGLEQLDEKAGYSQKLARLDEHYSKRLEDVRQTWELYKLVKNKAHWKDILIAANPDIPLDLIGRFDQRYEYYGGEEATPSAIALEWAARDCGIPDNTYRVRTLHEYLKKSRSQASPNLKGTESTAGQS
jgi:hypothetical protein